MGMCISDMLADLSKQLAKEIIDSITGRLEPPPHVECNSYGLTMWEVKTKYTVRTLGPIGSGG